MTRIADLVDVPTARLRDSGPLRSPMADGFSVRPWSAFEMAALDPAWRDLGLCAETPNPFYEYWFLAPSLQQFDPDGRVYLATHIVDGRLVGLMPLFHDRSYYGRPLPHLAGWLHPNSFCGEPLVAPGFAELFWQSLLDWCDSNRRFSCFLHLCNLPVEGASFRALQDLCGREGRSLAAVKHVRRAALRHGLSPDHHLAEAMDKKRRKELDRKRRRLLESGNLVFSRHTDSEGIDRWIDDFLNLESAGWKGTQCSALSSSPRTESFFREALSGAAHDGRLERIAFHLEGRAIAMLCTFLAPPMAFSFKTAFAEDLSKLSPGMLLQVENLRMLERDDIAMVDSCALPGHPMIEQIWPDRRELAMVNIAIGGRLRRKVGAILSSIEMRREAHRT